MRTLPLLILQACTLFDPTIEGLVATPGACGEWTAEVRAEGWSGDVELLLDGTPVRRWPLRGQLVAVEADVVDPGQTIELVAKAGDSFSRTTITTGGVTFTPTLRPEGGAVPRVSGTVGPSCALTGATWEADISPGGAHLTGPLSERGELDLRLPAGTSAPYTVAVTVVLRSGARYPMAPLSVAAQPSGPGEDRDHDGAEGTEDCNDDDAAVHPDAAEQQNGKDDDCDGVVDEGTPAYDDDGDGLSERAGDCDDGDPSRYPGAPEVPDCRDQDCDGTAADEGPRPHIDDAFEPNNGASSAHDLKTSSESSFERDLRVVTANANDDEWVQFYSADDMFDAWSIDVEAVQLPLGAAYDVEILGPHGNSLARATAEGTRVHLGGHAFVTESGEYRVHIKPVLVQPWCPAVFRLTSR